MIQPPAPLQPGFDLTGRNTLGLQARARYGGVLAEVSQIIAAARFARAAGLPFHMLGGGSNCVLAEDIPAVVGINGLRGRRVTETGDAVRVTAAAGEVWDDLVRWTVARGIGGLENLAGIPGTVGAAPIQNIGAYGVELAEVFESLTAIDTRTWEVERLDAEDCRFAYRHSRFKEVPGRFIVTEVTLRLPRDWAPVLGYAGLEDLPGSCGPHDVMQAVLARRGARLPDWRVTGNAGSFFHNPVVPAALARRLAEVPGHPVDGGVKLSAGRLLELCGFKGRRLGGAGFSEAHALVLVNHGGARFEDVRALAGLARRTVRDRFGVDLVQEPVTIGGAADG